MTEVRAGLLGLLTNVGCLSAPAGALIEAENVVCRKAGTVETRDGIKSLGAVSSGVPVWGLSSGAADYYVRYNASTFYWHRLSDNTAVTYDDPISGATNPQPFRRDCWTRADSRGNTYIPYDAGVLKLTSAPAFEMAGLPAVVNVLSTSDGAGTWLPNTQSVAYRLVAVHTDDSGLIVRSAPSGAVYHTNDSGGAASVLLAVAFADDFLDLFESVEVYRTRNFAAGVTVDDEMQLAGTIPLSSFSLSGTMYQAAFFDETAPAERGATLYTSPSLGGINEKNDRPPAAACIASYKQALFFGNVRTAHAMQFSFNYGGTVTGSATGVGDRTYTGNTTISVNTLTSMSSTTGLERGMVVSSGNFPAGTYITNISGTTLTLSANATASSVAGSVTFFDAFKLDGVWVPVADSFGYMAWWLASYGPNNILLQSVVPAKGGYNTTLVAESFSRHLTPAPTIQATHGGEYDPPLPTYSATAMDLPQDVLPGALYWSKTDEPEHVRPINFACVGDKSKAILGLAPTRDALYILKEDGVWRLTGVDGTWSIDPFDPTVFCMLPTSVQPMNGRVYFLGSRGVVSYGDDGSELISQPINDLVKPVINQVRANFLSTGYYELDGIVGGTSSVLDHEVEYTLARGSESTPLVFNENTRGWSTFKYQDLTTVAKALWTYDREGRAAYALDDSIYGTRLSTDSFLGTITTQARNDGESAITVSAYDAGSVSITLSTSNTALEDDIIQDADGVLWRVVNDAISTITVYLEGQSTIAFATGSCVLYRSIRTRVVPQPYSGPPNVQKRWDSSLASFERFDGPVALRYAYASSMTPRAADTWDVEDAVCLLEDGRAQYSMGYGSSGIVPNAHSRAYMLRAGVRWVQSHGTAQLEGLYVESESMEARSNQQRGIV